MLLRAQGFSAGATAIGLVVSGPRVSATSLLGEMAPIENPMPPRVSIVLRTCSRVHSLSHRPRMSGFQKPEVVLRCLRSLGCSMSAVANFHDYLQLHIVDDASDPAHVVAWKRALEQMGVHAEWSESSGGSPPGTMEVRVQTKGLDDDDDAAVFLDRQDMEGPWLPVSDLDPTDDPVYVSTARYAGFGELVRFQYLLAPIDPVKDFRVHSRMLPPLWQGSCLECSIEKELAKDVETTF